MRHVIIRICALGATLGVSACAETDLFNPFTGTPLFETASAPEATTTRPAPQPVVSTGTPTAAAAPSGGGVVAEPVQAEDPFATNRFEGFQGGEDDDGGSDSGDEQQKQVCEY